MARNKRYSQWLRDHGFEELRRLLEEGADEKAIAEIFGIDLLTLQRWKSEHDDFRAVFEIGSPNSDFRVINALYKKATGFNVELKKTYKLKTVEFDPGTGKKVREFEELAVGVDETYVPADLGAEKYWLESRRGSGWSYGDVGGGSGGVIMMPEADSLDEIRDGGAGGEVSDEAYMKELYDEVMREDAEVGIIEKTQKGWRR